MAVAARTLTAAGMEGIERHESALTTYALDRLRSVPDICFYGETDPRRTDDRIGVVSFNLGGFHHALVAAILAYEGGIGVRNGCFCAQPYVMRLLGLGAADQTRWRRAQLAGDNTGRPGMVRVSFAALQHVRGHRGRSSRCCTGSCATTTRAPTSRLRRAETTDPSATKTRCPPPFSDRSAGRDAIQVIPASGTVVRRSHPANEHRERHDLGGAKALLQQVGRDPR